jgi:hypothetical protein
VMKTFLLTFAKFLLFFFVFWVCNFLYPPFRLFHVVAITADGTQAFYWDGIVVMVLVLLVLLLIEAVRRRLATSGPWTVLAFALAFGLAWKWDFLTFTR